MGDAKLVLWIAWAALQEILLSLQFVSNVLEAFLSQQMELADLVVQDVFNAQTPTLVFVWSVKSVYFSIQRTEFVRNVDKDVLPALILSHVQVISPVSS